MKQVSPRITIITPSFNQGRFLNETIKSVLGQNYPNLEYIIIDGGSTDGSIKLLKKYASKYKHIIKWQSKKDKGQADAINKGLRKASGEIIAFINSDDYYLPGAFVRVAKYFAENPYKLWLVGDCRVSKESLAWTFFLKHIWPIHIFPSLLKVFNTVNQPSVFLRKELIDKVGYFNLAYTYAFDYDYWLRCSSVSSPGRLFKDLAVFRVHDQAKGSMTFYEQFDEDLKVVKNYTQNSTLLVLHRAIKRITTSSYKYLKNVG